MGKDTAKFFGKLSVFLRVTLNFRSGQTPCGERHSEFSDELVKNMLFQILIIIQRALNFIKEKLIALKRAIFGHGNDNPFYYFQF